MDKEKLEEFKRKSTSGSNGKRTQEKQKVSDQAYKSKIKMIILLSTLFTSVTLGAGIKTAKEIADVYTVRDLSNQFRQEAISPNRYYMEGPEYDIHYVYSYHYDQIANKVEDMDNFDEGMYYVIDNMGLEQADKVIRYTDNYNDIDEYMKDKGYTSIDEYKKDMRKEIILSTEIKEKQSELEAMKNDITVEDQEAIKGGAK